MGNLALYRQDVIRPALERIDWLLWLDEVGGNLFKNEWLTDWSDIPELRWRAIYADTAQKVGQKNDYSVFQVWGAKPQPFGTSIRSPSDPVRHQSRHCNGQRRPSAPLNGCTPALI